MDSTKALRYALALMLTATIGFAGCDAVGGAGGAALEEVLDGDLDGQGEGGGDQIDDGSGGGGSDEAGGAGDPIQIEVFATNTGTDASGIALNPTDDGLYLVSGEGLFGPIEEGADVMADLDPLGAENLFDPDLFDHETRGFVLSISEAGVFWIGTSDASTLAVVPSEGGPAQPFLGLLRGGVDVSNVKPATMAFIPDGFSGPQMQPGHLLVGEEAGQSDLTAIDVEGFGEVDDGMLVLNVDKPVDDETGEAIMRFANHLAFGQDGTLYGARQVSSAVNAGVQTIDTDGFPTDLPGTTGLSAISFVVLKNDDLLIRGVYDPDPGNEPSVNGIVLWEAEGQEVTVFEDLPDDILSGYDELIISADRSTVYLALPERGEIWRGIDNR